MNHTELDEETLKAAVILIRKEVGEPEKVLQFIYSLGYFNGGLDMAKVGTKRISEEVAAQKAMA